MHYDWKVFGELDWSHRGEYMEARHGITVALANDAVSDANRVLVNPGYNSESGRTVRIVGYSQVAGAIITVIAMADGGIDYGVNGWISNEKDQRIYREATVDGQD